jgi:hypothetical protein
MEQAVKLLESGEVAKLRRRTLIRLATQRQRPGTGSASMRSGDEYVMQWPDLRQVLDGTSWAVIGAVATRLYMPERATRDLDILVLATSAAEVARRLANAGFIHVGPLAIGGSTWTAPNGTPIYVIEVDEVWASRAIAEAQTNRDRGGAPVVTLPFLVLMKLAASRVQDLADVSRMLGASSNADRAAVRQVVHEYAPDLREDLESLIQLGLLESEGDAR